MFAAADYPPFLIELQSRDSEVSSKLISCPEYLITRYLKEVDMGLIG